MHTVSLRQARRLALARSGLLKPEWTGMPAGCRSSRAASRNAACSIIERFGYLQLDTVSIAGARSHALVLMSRLRGFDPQLGEELLQPGAPLFEYWGHEASWIPLDLYPAFEFRRREFRRHPWWGDIIGAHRAVAKDLVRRIRDEGPVRSIDLEGEGSRGWWELKDARRVAAALWSSGELAIRERRNFQRSFDLTERVIPEEVRSRPLPAREGIALLLERALQGHGWATTGTLAATWRLRNRRAEIQSVMDQLVERGRVCRSVLAVGDGQRVQGWIRPEDLELASKLDSVRPRADRGVLLSPFDPVLWDRSRVARFFGFDQVLEVFKPAGQRVYGYFCLPVLAGERLVARVDLKAERSRGALRVLSCRLEDPKSDSKRSTVEEAVRSALSRYSSALALRLE